MEFTYTNKYLYLDIVRDDNKYLSYIKWIDNIALVFSFI